MNHDKVLSIIDLETSGPSYQYNKIIEVGIIQMKEGKVFNEFNTLVNPEEQVNDYILSMTGIRQEDLDKSPTFYAVKDELFEMLKGTVIVAHNVRFDYGFLKAEFKRYKLDFIEQNICTVRLSRKLFPEYRKHNLDALINRFSISCENRHRALDDAKVLKDFLLLLPDYFSDEELKKAYKELQKGLTLPPKLKAQDLKEIPDQPGIYYFYGDTKHPLYIGKSNKVQTRVYSHFSSSNTSSRELKIFEQITKVDYQRTAGELGALILESEMIKEKKPLHNKKLRRLKNLHLVIEDINEQGYKMAKILNQTKINSDEISKIIGIFPSRDKAKEFLKNRAKDYKLCPNVLEGKDSKDTKRCFYLELDLCFGTCIGEERVSEYNERFNQAFQEKRIPDWPFNSPILINETYPNQSGDKGDIFIFNSWCLIAKGSYEGTYHEINPLQELTFDKDIYKILKRYLKKKPSKTAIKQLTFREYRDFIS